MLLSKLNLLFCDSIQGAQIFKNQNVFRLKFNLTLSNCICVLAECIEIERTHFKHIFFPVKLYPSYLPLRVDPDSLSTIHCDVSIVWLVVGYKADWYRVMGQRAENVEVQPIV